MRKKISIISVVLLILLSGCADPESTISLDRMNNEEQVANSTTLNYKSVSKPLKNAVVTGESNKTDYNYLGNDKIRYNGKIYSINSEKVGEESRIRFEYNMTISKNNAPINYKNLIKEDQETIDSGVRKINNRNSNKIRFGNTYPINIKNESKLLENNTTFINYKNKTYKFELNDKTVIDEDVYIYNRKLISNSIESYGEYIINEYAFNITISSDKQRNLVDRSIENNYYGSQNKTVEALISKFNENKAYKLEESRGVWFVRYNDKLYMSELSWRGDMP